VVAHYIDNAKSTRVTDDEMAYLAKEYSDDCSDIKKERTQLLPENYEAGELVDFFRLAVPVPLQFPFPVTDAYLKAHRMQLTDPDDCVDKCVIVFAALSNEAIKQNGEQAKQKPHHQEFMQ
jgi:hypothetical protein